MLEIVAAGIMTAILYVGFILMKGMKATGKIVKNVEMHLKQKCMFIMELMSIILRNLKIHQHMNQRDAQDAMKLLF